MASGGSWVTEVEAATEEDAIDVGDACVRMLAIEAATESETVEAGGTGAFEIEGEETSVYPGGGGGGGNAEAALGVCETAEVKDTGGTGGA